MSGELRKLKLPKYLDWFSSRKRAHFSIFAMSYAGDLTKAFSKPIILQQTDPPNATMLNFIYLKNKLRIRLQQKVISVTEYYFGKSVSVNKNKLKNCLFPTHPV